MVAFIKRKKPPHWDELPQFVLSAQTGAVQLSLMAYFLHLYKFPKLFLLPIGVKLTGSAFGFMSIS